MESPYRPGFGVRPAVLVGREEVLSRASATLSRVENSGAPAAAVTVLIGSRGLGKTVTLFEIAAIAAGRNFITCSVSLDSVSDNIQLLAGRIAEPLSDLEGRVGPVWERFLRRLSSLSLELNAGVVKVTSSRPEPRPQAGTVARQALADLIAKATEIAVSHHHTGLALFIDELQEAPKDQLVVLANVIQDTLTSSQPLPIAIFAAGLPQTPERVMAAASFTERFDFRVLERLDAASAERALLEPALEVGVSWQPEAAEEVLTEAAGSPYLIQLLGEEAWLAAPPEVGGSIGSAQTRLAIERVRESLGVGMFRGRWAKATRAQQQLLVAIATVLDPAGVAHTRDISQLLGRTTPQLSSTRKALIDKGLIESAGTGMLRFTMPGFAEFLLDQNPGAESDAPRSGTIQDG